MPRVTKQATAHNATSNPDRTADLDLGLDPTRTTDPDVPQNLLSICSTPLFGIRGHGMAVLVESLYKGAPAGSRVMFGRDPAAIISLLGNALAVVHETKRHGTENVSASQGKVLAEKLWPILLEAEGYSLEATRYEEDIRMKVGHVSGVAEHRIEAIKKHRRVPIEWFGNVSGVHETTERRYAAVLRDFDNCFYAVNELILGCASKMNGKSWYPFYNAVLHEMADMSSHDYHAKADARKLQRAADVARAYGSITLVVDHANV